MHPPKSRPAWRLLFVLPALALLAGCPASETTGPDGPATGDLEVSVATAGEDLDPDGYDVRVDEGATKKLAVNGSVEFKGLSPGQHTIALSGLMDNCTVVGDNPLTVQVSQGSTASGAFAVACVRRTGAMSVAAATSGEEVDPDGYMLMVDGAEGGSLDVNGSMMIDDLSEGDHDVELSGVAANCTVSGDNPRSLAVAFKGTAQTTFEVTCSATTGDLEVTTSTTGDDIDPDGYTVTVDGGTTLPIDANGSVAFNDLGVGDHSVQLGDVAANCMVSGENPRTVSVTTDAAAQTTFEVACSDRTGDLDVTTATTGSDIDSDGYTVTVDGTSSQSIGTGETLTFSGLAEGDHTVELSDVADNCTVAGNNPRTVSVPFDGTAQTTFDVNCAPSIGDLKAVTETSGADLDPDGYTVTVDGTLNQNVGVNGSVTFANLSTGDHTVALSGLAANCSVAGENPRTVTVTFGETAETTFEVDCASTTGDLKVDATTTGTDLDPDGYIVTVDDASPRNLGVNGSVAYDDLSVGDHQVELTDLAANCSVTGDNPRTVSVPSGGLAETEFDVTCVENLGSLKVNTSTTGVDPDPDGYTVTLDGTLIQNVGADGSVTFNNLDVGEHSVALSGVAGNCTIQGNNPRDVTVTFNSTAETTFEVECEALTGDLEVNASTGGSDLDPDGYTVVLDGTTNENIGVNGSVTFEDLPVGDHTVELSGVAANCDVDGENPRTVNVVGGGVQTTFDVHCFGPLRDKIAFESDRDGNFEVYVMNDDGTAQTNLTNDPGLDRQPDVSPDGLRIAFSSGRDGENDIWVMGAEGTGLKNLTEDLSRNTSWPAWSPDGTRIAFVRRAGGDDEIWVMDADGSNKTAITDNLADDLDPSWSPDGTKLAFTSHRDGHKEIYVADLIAGTETNLTNNPAEDFLADWSPDGTQIAFSSDRDGDPDIYVMNSDGTLPVNLTNAAGLDRGAAWSPDGTKIAFGSERDGNFEIYIMNADGTGQVRLTVHADFDDLPSISP